MVKTQSGQKSTTIATNQQLCHNSYAIKTIRPSKKESYEIMIKKQILLMISLGLTCNAIAMELNSNNNLNGELAGAVRKRDIQYVKDLLARKADINWSCEDGLTPLIRATFEENTEVVKTLLEAKADLEKKTCYGTTALMMATIRRRQETVQTLINAGANVNFRDPDGFTPFIMAIDAGDQEIAAMLLQAKADIYQANNCKKTALHIAAENYRSDMVEFLLNEISLVSPLEKNSVKSWLLVARRLQDEKRGLSKDLKNLIAQTIWKSLVKDVHTRLVKFGAFQALTFLEKCPDVHELDPRIAGWVETSEYLNRALSMEALKGNVLKQLVGKNK